MSEQERNVAPRNVALVGTGFVADLYMRSLESMPDIQVIAAYDHNQDRLDRFCAHWKVQPAASLDDLHTRLPRPGLVLNLTNPGAHYTISRASLEAGHHVYSEKPLADNVDHARELVALATAADLQIASAPCSVLSEAAQTAWKAIRDGVLKGPRLVYAELDDGFIPQAPYKSWISESGTPWPHDDEFRVGCTLEHAGYFLTWLMAMFGRVRTVNAASATLVGDLHDTPDPAPDFSVAVLFFESGIVARLTSSIIAPHDHSLRIIGENGVLEMAEAWNNTAPVRLRRRHRLRRRLFESPFARRVRPARKTHPKVGRSGAASMNFALGPAEMLEAIAAGRPARLAGDFALHLTEVVLAIQSAGETGAPVVIESDCPDMAPMDWTQ